MASGRQSVSGGPGVRGQRPRGWRAGARFVLAVGGLAGTSRLASTRLARLPRDGDEHHTRPSSSFPAAWARISRTSGGSIRPPRPCRTRKAMSAGIDHASPHSIDPVRNVPSEARNIARPPNRAVPTRSAG
jgi:hypothetical protein